MNKSRKKIIKGTFTVFMFLILSSFIGYFLKFLFAKNLDVESIGLFFSVYAFVTFFIFLRDFGLSEALVYFIPKFLAKNKKKELKSSIVFTLYVQLTMGISFLLIMILLSDYLTTYYFKDPRAKLLIVFMSIYVVIDAINEILFRVFHGFQNMFYNQLIEFSFQFFSVLIFVLFFYLNIKLEYLAFSYVISGIITAFIFSIIFYKIFLPDFFLIKTKISKLLKKKLLDYSIPAMTGSLAIVFFTKQTVFFLTLFAGLSSVGYYVMLRALGKISLYFFNAIKQVFSPMITELWSKKHTKELQMHLNELIDYTLILALPIGITLSVYSKEIITLLYSLEFAKVSHIMSLISISFILLIPSVLFRTIFLSIGKPKDARNLVYFSFIINLILNIVLIKLYGLLGAIISEIVTNILASIYGYYIYKKLTKIKLNFFSMLKIGFSSCIFFIIIYFQHSIYGMNLLTLFIFLVISSFTYLLFLFNFKVIEFKKIQFMITNLFK
jgi:O-antigen/teichoic acid export membrane protein